MPKVNLTELSDEEFVELGTKIGALSISRHRHITNAIISNEVWNKGRLCGDVKGYCARCNCENIWPSVSILSEGGSAECFICHECGQAHTNNFYAPYYATAVRNLKLLNKKYEKVAIWGQGRRLAQIFESYSDAKALSFYYVDISPAKWGQFFYHLRINRPETLLDYKPDVLVVAVGDANVSTTYDKISSLREENKNTDISRLIFDLGELMNPEFKV